MTDEDVKPDVEANPDVLESVFEEAIIEEDEVVEFLFPDENDTTPDIAFQANDEDYW